MFVHWKESYDKPRPIKPSVWKREDISLPREVHIVKTIVFSVVMYEWESWTRKKAESWRIDAFELWSWQRLLRVPGSARRSNQSILKEISPEYWLEGLILKLKLQYFGHLMRRVDLLEQTLMLGKIEGKRRRGQQRVMNRRHHWLKGDDVGQGHLVCCSPWGHEELDMTERLSDKWGLNEVKHLNSLEQCFPW